VGRRRHFQCFISIVTDALSPLGGYPDDDARATQKQTG
jgi:hypothetical protein